MKTINVKTIKNINNVKNTNNINVINNIVSLPSLSLSLSLYPYYGDIGVGGI